MGDTPATEEQLAMLLQASRNFALEQMARGDRLIPFASRAKSDGEVEFTRFADEDSKQPLDEIYALMEQAVAKEVAQGGLLAAGLVAAVRLDAPEGGFEQALRIQIEAPDYARQVLVPYGLEPAASAEEKASLKLGQMQVYEAQAVLFAE